MVVRNYRLWLGLIASCIIGAALPGCGNYSSTIHSQVYQYEPNAIVVKRPVAASPAAAPADPNDPLLDGGDPLDKDGDPLSREASNPATDPLERRSDSIDGKMHSHGWYWLEGAIQGGRLGVLVNGISIGKYRDYIHNEITWYCHPGENTLTFVHYPDRGSGLCLVSLRIVNKRPPADATVLTYDTQAEITDPDMGGGQRLPSPPVSTQIPGRPPDQMPLSSPVASSPVSEMRSFIDP